MNTQQAIAFLAGVRVFVTSRERIKHPEGVNMFDEAIAALQTQPADRGRGSASAFDAWWKSFDISSESPDTMDDRTFAKAAWDASIADLTQPKSDLVTHPLETTEFVPQNQANLRDNNSLPAAPVVGDGMVVVPKEVRDLYDFMVMAFTPFTSQQKEIAISLKLAKAAVQAAAAPGGDPL